MVSKLGFPYPGKLHPIKSIYTHAHAQAQSWSTTQNLKQETYTNEKQYQFDQKNNNKTESTYGEIATRSG